LVSRRKKRREENRTAIPGATCFGYILSFVISSLRLTRQGFLPIVCGRAGIVLSARDQRRTLLLTLREDRIADFPARVCRTPGVTRGSRGSGGGGGEVPKEEEEEEERLAGRGDSDLSSSIGFSSGCRRSLGRQAGNQEEVEGHVVSRGRALTRDQRDASMVSALVNNATTLNKHCPRQNRDPLRQD